MVCSVSGRPVPRADWTQATHEQNERGHLSQAGDEGAVFASDTKTNAQCNKGRTKSCPGHNQGFGVILLIGPADIFSFRLLAVYCKKRTAQLFSD